MAKGLAWRSAPDQLTLARHRDLRRDHRLFVRRALLALVLDGEPVIIVEDGKPIERNLRRNRLTVGEVAPEARLQQLDSLERVRWAMLETNGKISFIPKS